MEIEGLCDELVGEILDRIPIKQVIRMKCLSKSWFRLIVRYRESKPRASTSTFLLQYKTGVHRDSNQVLFLRAKEQPQQQGTVMEKLLGYSVDEHINFMGSSNGLLLFNQFVNPDKLITYVCNPAAKQWQWDTLPPLFHSKNLHQSIQIGVGLAFDGAPNQPYKVIYYTELRWQGDLEFQIYSSDTQEWGKQIKRIPNSALLHMQGEYTSYRIPLEIDSPHLFWKGMLLSIAQQEHNYYNENLLVHHIQNNSFKVMRLPQRDEHRGGGGFLWESQGYLHYCQNVVRGFCVWKYVDYNFSWETFTNMESDFGKWKLLHAVNIGTLVSQHPEVYGPIGVHYGRLYLKLFEACAFDEGLQILYILLPTTIISYSFETRKLSKVWTIEGSEDLNICAPRSLSFQLSGTLGGDSILSLPKPEPQGPPLMVGYDIS